MTETPVQIKLPSALSPSTLESYRTCPRKFYYEKIEKLPTTSNVKAELGTLGHAVLEELMKLDAHLRTAQAAKDIAAKLWQELIDGDRQPELLAMLDVEMTRPEMKAHVWKSVQGFFSLVKPKSVTVVSTEQYVTGFVGTVPMRGYVDFTELVDGKLRVADTKTGKAPWGDSVASKLTQVGVYCALLEDLQPREVSSGVLLYVHPRKMFELKWNPEAKADIVSQAERVWADIQEDFRNGWFAPNPNFLCSNDDPAKVWCDFKNICPAWSKN